MRCREEGRKYRSERRQQGKKGSVRKMGEGVIKKSGSVGKGVGRKC